MDCAFHAKHPVSDDFNTDISRCRTELDRSDIFVHQTSNSGYNIIPLELGDVYGNRNGFWYVFVFFHGGKTNNKKFINSFIC